MSECSGYSCVANPEVDLRRHLRIRERRGDIHTGGVDASLDAARPEHKQLMAAVELRNDIVMNTESPGLRGLSNRAARRTCSTETES